MNEWCIEIFKKAKKNVMENLEVLLWVVLSRGYETEFQDVKDVNTANILINILQRIDSILPENDTMQSSETDREIELRAVKAELEQYKQKCKKLEWDLRSYELTHEKAIAEEE